MSIEELNRVDVVSRDRDGNYELTISDHWDWVIDFDHLDMLQEKINNYLVYIEGGELVQRFPDADGKKVSIDVRFLYQPSELGQRFLAAVKETVEGAGFGFSYQVDVSGMDVSGMLDKTSGSKSRPS